MTMDLGALPPEVSSAMIYSGPGSSSMMAAASAWNALAAELASTAQGMDKVVVQLASEGWLGPSSAAMAAARACWSGVGGTFSIVAAGVPHRVSQ